MTAFLPLPRSPNPPTDARQLLYPACCAIKHIQHGNEDELSTGSGCRSKLSRAYINSYLTFNHHTSSVRMRWGVLIGHCMPMARPMQIPSWIGKSNKLFISIHDVWPTNLRAIRWQNCMPMKHEDPGIHALLGELQQKGTPKPYTIEQARKQGIFMVGPW